MVLPPHSGAAFSSVVPEGMKATGFFLRLFLCVYLKIKKKIIPTLQMMMN